MNANCVEPNSCLFIRVSDDGKAGWDYIEAELFHHLFYRLECSNEKGPARESNKALESVFVGSLRGCMEV